MSHLFRVHVQVRWTMTASPRTADTTDFTCVVELIMPTTLRVAAALIFTPHFVRAHVAEETPGFVADIERKLVAASA